MPGRHENVHNDAPLPVDLGPLPALDTTYQPPSCRLPALPPPLAHAGTGNKMDAWRGEHEKYQTHWLRPHTDTSARILINMVEVFLYSPGPFAMRPVISLNEVGRSYIVSLLFRSVSSLCSRFFPVRFSAVGLHRTAVSYSLTGSGPFSVAQRSCASCRSLLFGFPQLVENLFAQPQGLCGGVVLRYEPLDRLQGRPHKLT